MKSGSERACSKSRRRARPIWKRAANSGWLRPSFSRVTLTSRASTIRLSCSLVCGGLSGSESAWASISASVSLSKRRRSSSENRYCAPRLRVKWVLVIVIALRRRGEAGRNDSVEIILGSCIDDAQKLVIDPSCDDASIFALSKGVRSLKFHRIVKDITGQFERHTVLLDV